MISFRFVVRVTPAFCAAVLCLGLAGCGQGTAEAPSVFSVSVLLDGEPVEHVRVALIAKENRSGPVMLEGVSIFDGTAKMQLVEATQAVDSPTEFVVVCESLGDWDISEPWSSAEKSPLTLTWGGEESLSIELPKKAVRRL